VFFLMQDGRRLALLMGEISGLVIRISYRITFRDEVTPDNCNQSDREPMKVVPVFPGPFRFVKRLVGKIQ